MTDHLSWLIGEDEKLLFSAQSDRISYQLHLAKELHFLGKKIGPAIPPSKPEDQRVLVLALFFRVMNSHKAFVREAAFGYWAEAETIARSAIEALILLAEAIRNPDFYRAYSKSQEQLLFNIARSYTIDGRRQSPVLTRPKLKVDFESIQSKLKESGVGGIDLARLAIDNGYEELYRINYALLNSAVHVKPDSTRRHYELTEHGHLQLSQLPTQRFPNQILGQINLIYFDAATRVVNYFDLGILKPELTKVGVEILNMKKEGMD